MTWFKVDDGFWRGSKVRRLGRARVTVQSRVASAGLWMLAGNWAGDQLTDGFVPWEQIEDWDPQRKLSERLIRAGLWDEDEVDGEDGIRFHDWSDYQPTRSEVEERRRKTRQRVQRHRARKNGAPQPPDGDAAPDDPADTPDDLGEYPDDVAPPVTAEAPGNSVGNALHTPLDTHPRPDPTRPVSSGRSGRGSSGTERARAQRPPASGAQQELGLIGSVPNLPSEAPRCTRHAHLPADADVPACRPCQHRREDWETATAAAAAERAERERAAAAALTEAANDCERCDGRWVTEYPGGPPVEPALKCTHGLRVLHATG